MSEVCEKCGKTVSEKSLAVLQRYEELKDKKLCPVCRDEKLKELGYWCKACGQRRTEPGRDRCYDCSKKNLLPTDGSIEEKRDEPKAPSEGPPASSAIVLLKSESPVIRPAIPPDQARAEWKELKHLKRAIEDRDDYIEIKDKRTGEKRRFYNKRFFRKMAMYCCLSDEIVKEEIVRGRLGNVLSAYYVVRVIAPNGRIITNVGMCSSTERAFSHPDHDIISTALTRAKSRCISDAVAGGEVTAEEMGYYDVEEEGK